MLYGFFYDEFVSMFYTFFFFIIILDTEFKNQEIRTAATSKGNKNRRLTNTTFTGSGNVLCFYKAIQIN